MQFGSRGWQHRAWAGSFYPDDLPSEWRLPFYTNEFDTVLIPSSELLDADQDQIQAWLEDSGDDFTFFVEFDDRHEFSQQFQMAQVLLPQLAGIVLNTSMEEQKLSADSIRVLTSNTLGGDIQIYAPMPAAKDVALAETQLVYNIETTLAPNNRRCLGLLRSNTITTAALTDLLGVLHKIDGGCGALFFTAAKPEIGLLRQASTIYELSY